jgi:rod shape-determining protein MreC
MFKRPYYILMLGVGLLALVVIGLPERLAGQIKLALSGLFLPLFGLAGAGSKVVDKAASMAMPKQVLEAQLAAARKENEQLHLELIQAGQLMRENDQLRAAVGWQRRSPWTLKLVKVLARDPANWWRTVQINAGSRDGIGINMPVITTNGLVGRVDEVGFTASRVALLGDPNCRVAAWVEESQDRGIIAPGGSTVLDQSIVELTYLSRHSKAKPGHRVITSGEGGIFPPRIPLGQIVDIESVGQGLYLEARVKLAADIQRLDMVWVLMSWEGKK